MAFVAATLAVVSILHLSGSGDGGAAGIPEAIIGVVLTGGAIVVWRGAARARITGLVTTGFAIFGFLVGLSFTAREGPLPDLAYHLATLPILIAIFGILLGKKMGKASRNSMNAARTGEHLAEIADEPRGRGRKSRLGVETTWAAVRPKPSHDTAEPGAAAQVISERALTSQASWSA